MREIENVYTLSVGKPGWKRPFGDLGVDGKITLKRVLGKEGGGILIACSIRNIMT
jgi:hypothetical protein